MRRGHPLYAGGLAVGVALLVAGVWCGRSRAPVVESAVQATVAVRIARHDAFGMASKPVVLRDPARVRALVEALGVDRHSAVPCPSDYAEAELGLTLEGRDVYARRNVYVWGLTNEGAPTTVARPASGGAAPTGNSLVVVVSSAGCRGGAPADAMSLRRELSRADAGL